MKEIGNKKVLVTGGASFIGSHLVEDLVDAGANVVVADNLSSGRLENLAAVQEQIEFAEGDLKRPAFTESVMEDVHTVFHLAADHGVGDTFRTTRRTVRRTWLLTTPFSRLRSTKGRTRHVRLERLYVPDTRPGGTGTSP